MYLSVHCSLLVHAWVFHFSYKLFSTPVDTAGVGDGVCLAWSGHIMNNLAGMHCTYYIESMWAYIARSEWIWNSGHVVYSARNTCWLNDKFVCFAERANWNTRSVRNWMCMMCVNAGVASVPWDVPWVEVDGGLLECLYITYVRTKG